MAKNNGPFDKGDWIVHTYYGVGQIVGVESKTLGEEVTKYYKVNSRNSTYFIPIENAENDRVRPIASTYRIRKISKLLKSEPVDLEEKHTSRKREISERISEGSLEAMAKLIRDLNGRRKRHGLNDYDNKTLEDLTGRLVREWSISQEIEPEEAEERLEALLEEALDKVPEKE